MMAVLLVLIIAAIRIYALVFTSVLPYCRRLPFFTQSQCLASSQPPWLYMKASGGVLLRFFFFLILGKHTDAVFGQTLHWFEWNMLYVKQEFLLCWLQEGQFVLGSQSFVDILSRKCRAWELCGWAAKQALNFCKLHLFQCLKQMVFASCSATYSYFMIGILYNSRNMATIRA